MRTAVPNEMGGRVVRALIRSIEENRQFLSEIDGLIGDGDHGVNMSKGFSMAESRLTEEGFSPAFETLGFTLLDDIGGSMGPLYGSIFLGMSAWTAPAA
jgi:dihydroxyacetone kinase